METSFFHSSMFSYVIMPLLIFLARICDVSIGTLRIIFVSLPVLTQRHFIPLRMLKQLMKESSHPENQTVSFRSAIY